MTCVCWDSLIMMRRYPLNMGRRPNSVLILVNCQRLWPKIAPALGQRLVVS